MPKLKTSHRPTTVDEALQLLSRSGPRATIIAGGTTLTSQLDDQIEEIIDLQAVGLNQITPDDDHLTLGAMVRLQAIVDCPDAPDLLRQSAHREGPNTLRNAATIGGVIVSADWESELLAALLVFDAQVKIQNAAGTKTIPLADFLAGASAWLQDGLLTSVTIAATGTTAVDRVARTPADKPIVAAVARKTSRGQRWLALCGVAPTPILINHSQLDALQPPADFRGSSEYRLAMAKVLSERVLTQLDR